jgi:Putative outer membrane beta-barrel porin, MtrB/PioB
MTAEVYQLKISAASHPIPNVDTRVFYGLDARSVSVDQNKVDTGGEGGGTADAGLTTGTYNYVVPQDWFKQNAGAEVGYRILPASDTKVTVGYRYDGIDRSNAQVGRSSTSTATVAVLSELGSQVNGKISFDYSDRTGTISYLTPWANLAGSPSGQTYSGAYYQAPMTSEAVTFRADYTPMHVLTSGVFLQFKNENYTYGDVSPVGTATAATIPLTGEGGGVKQDYTLTVGPDINYRPTETINVHLFYTFEMLYYNNLGNGACSTPSTATTAACKGTAGYFQNTYSSSTNTIGLSGEWQINEKLKLRGDYTLSYGTVMFGEYNGVFVGTPTASYQNVGNYPDINSLMNSIKVTATYQLRPDIQLIAEGFYTSFHNNDWDDTANAIQGAGTSAISILTPGYASPNYSIVALVAGIKFRF